jgi:Transposase IS116/IS110/IS902 family
MTIPAVGLTTALAWALEIGDMQMFRRSRKPLAIEGCAEQKEVGQHGTTHAAVETLPASTMFSGEFE